MKEIKDTLLNSTPVTEVTHRYDTTYQLLPLGEWIVETLRDVLPGYDANASGKKRAAETRSIKGDVAIFKIDKDDWKVVTAHYNVIRKEYERDQRGLMKSLDVRSAKHWQSGRITVSLSPDAVEASKAEGFKAPVKKEAKKKK